jgi:sugar lactone lactonase YvrE
VRGAGQVHAVRRTLAAGFRLPESLRWHDEQLWMSDMDGGVVNRIGPSGAEQVCAVLAQPSGLGWDPDGVLLVVSQLDARLLRLTPAGLRTVAELSDVLHAAGGDVRPNDMYVTGDGTAYIGSVSFEVVGGRLLAEDSRPTPLVKVTPDGEVSVLTSELKGPNGIAPAPRGDGLLVAETRSGRIVRVGFDGSVARYADCGAAPDGLWLDQRGRLWAAFPFAGHVRCFDEHATVVAQVATPGRLPLDCALDGAEGATLFVASVEVIDHLGTARTGRIDGYFNVLEDFESKTKNEMEGLS